MQVLNPARLTPRSGPRAALFAEAQAWTAVIAPAACGVLVLVSLFLRTMEALRARSDRTAREDADRIRFLTRDLRE